MKKRRIVIKLSSTTPHKVLRESQRGKLEDIARQINELKEDHEIIIVTSEQSPQPNTIYKLTKEIPSSKTSLGSHRSAGPDEILPGSIQ